MIDPTISLAFSVHSAPGRYAILLGSGVSSAAGIPTGWSITLDLMRKLAVAQGERCDDDPEAWYREKHGQSPNYSQILNELAKTPSDRREVLSSYIEQDSDDPDAERRQPTAAHRAIASLVADGYINVIITTNFDRLLEQALSAVNVAPVILSTPDQVEGAPPLSQTKCTIFKVHGDYLDPGIRNTEDELEIYPESFDNLLDKIIDEYGLIVCGWSAEWDLALRSAFDRATTRRFATYWTHVGNVSLEAKALIDRREAEVLQIDDADSFFGDLYNRVAALRDHVQHHPKSVIATVSLYKRYLASPEHRIQMRDLLDRVVAEVVQENTIERFPINGDFTVGAVTSRLDDYESIATTLIPVCMIAGSWGDSETVQYWRSILSRLSRRETGSGTTGLLFLEMFPATLTMYSLGIGAIYGERLDFLAELIASPIQRQYNSRWGDRAGTVFHPAWFSGTYGGPNPIRDYERSYAPLSDWLHDHLKGHAIHLTADSELYTTCFDTFEILLALSFANKPPDSVRNFIPYGSFGHRIETRENILQEIETSLTLDGGKSRYVSSETFGSTVDECMLALNRVRQERTKYFDQW